MAGSLTTVIAKALHRPAILPRPKVVRVVGLSAGIEPGPGNREGREESPRSPESPSHPHYTKVYQYAEDMSDSTTEPAVLFVHDDVGAMPSNMSRDDVPKMADHSLYNRGYGLPITDGLLPGPPPSVAPTENTGGLVESGVTLDLMGRGGKMTSVRRTFCLFVLFDLIMMFILWVIYTQLIGDTGYHAFEKQVMDYTFKTSLFDTVLVACFRFTCLLLFYALFRLRHWVVVAITTGLSSAFLIIKIFLYDFGGTKSSSNPLSYCLIIISFVLAWVETWFLDFKVLPQEKKMEQRMSQGARRAYGSTGGRYDGRYQRFPDDMQSVMTEDNAFYSPLGTPEGSDNEDEYDRGDGRNRSGAGSSKENDYIRLAKHCFDILWTYINSPEAEWKLETGTDEVKGIVHSKKIKGVGKVFRTKGVVEMNAKDLFENVSFNPEDMPRWNPTMKEAKILQKVDENIDVIYNVSAEVAGGVISSRDFISVRMMGERDGYYLGSGMAVNHPDMPVQKQYVRGVNGAGGFVFQPDPEDPDNRCRFIWFTNTDIKGWIPQKVIDTSMAKVGMDFLGYLRAHAVEMQNNSR